MSPQNIEHAPKHAKAARERICAAAHTSSLPRQTTATPLRQTDLAKDSTKKTPSRASNGTMDGNSTGTESDRHKHRPSQPANPKSQPPLPSKQEMHRHPCIWPQKKAKDLLATAATDRIVWPPHIHGQHRLATTATGRIDWPHPRIRSTGHNSHG